ncbi:AAA domain-containing protein [Paenibacillus cellulosilyticus]|uniref:AAA domain-containing protein n=1 Tax=Paenibacillus cellulosilyticus TaxID=375489 RepID=A0A2V2YY05_9BACL|nr:AAA family ATPase [Paenibacillus cellulosilyticus]PWW06141.1 AAA domain-containing protein [Paenibacillus cellulosilyticus]QKS43090.1 AAA family ATPase [Paenibacillus cellulosilyticus]
MLYIFSGLPGAGKSTLSTALARELRAVHLRVDVVEQTMRDAGIRVEGPEGYMVCYGLASHNLRLGLDVIADTVNPIPMTRQAWREVAESLQLPYVEIEVICSDKEEHKRRVTTRIIDIPGLVPPTWEQVVNRDYEAWDRKPIIIDTSHRSIAESMQMLREQLIESRKGYRND